MRINPIAVAFLGCFLILSTALPHFISKTSALEGGSVEGATTGFTHAVLDETVGWTS